MDLNCYYNTKYNSLRSRGIIGYGHRSIHKKLELKLSRELVFNSVIELGAGSGQHYEFVKHNYLEYFETDLRLENLPPRNNAKVKRMTIDATNLKEFSNDYFDRIISTCLVVHLADPETALKEWRRVSKNNCTLDIYVHCEPGFVLRVLRAISINRNSKKLGVNHYSMIYRDHVTYFPRVDFLIKEVFKEDSIRRFFWPLCLPFWNLNIGVFYRIKIKKP